MRKIIITESQLKKLIDETVEGLEISAYHGSETEIKTFVDEFVGADEANDQEGPGIYFTTNYEEASRYGKYLYHVLLTPRKLVDDNTPSEDVDPETLKTIIKSLPEWEYNAMDWDENPEIGLDNAVTSAIQYNDTEKDVFQQVWIEFFRYNPVEFVREMTKLGYDGQLIKKENETNHIIIYNPAVIEVKKIES